MHETVKKLYSWHHVAEKTEKVYYEVVQMPRLTTLSKLKLKLTLGPIAGIGNIVSGIFWLIALFLAEWIWPRESIDIAEEFNTAEYRANPEKFGNHKFHVREDEQSQQGGDTANSTGAQTKQRTSMKQ
mmetsp:Transcript_11657/g.15805  ORF Transcript_11657/g.15805 Transcript_11657/m.15805 type:complete len:128 (+) Transcript_11657:1263-1646(+)